jgi:chorismate mutase
MEKFSVHSYISSGNPLLIAGPCGVESRTQFFDTVAGLAQIDQVKIIRGGLWKPRTRPNSFEGMGEAGIPWMTEMKAQFSLPIMTEVARAQHVELCLENNFDALWLGARTVANPFSVQEIADALKGVDIPIFIKNPIHADLALWMGAIERIQNAGIKEVVAIHRGFATGAPTLYRNQPLWEMPIALKTAMPSIPIICDPSHIAGKRELLQPVAQKAMDLGMSGWMIESHFSPDDALSDAQQQITPLQLQALIASITLRIESTEETENCEELNQWRKSIDEVDQKIIQLLGERMKIAEEIGVFKKEKGITIFSLPRWKEILENRQDWGEHAGLTLRFLKTYLEAIHSESIRHQEKVMNQH